MREMTYGSKHPRVAAILNNLAQVLCELGEPATARPLLERALRINEAHYGPDHPMSLHARKRLHQLNGTPE
jgi:Tfp pilus assembly protein PilF